MTIFAATVGAASAEVYGGVTACTAYLSLSSSAGAVAFRALAPDDQARALIDATRYLDAYGWPGAPTTPAVGGTTLQWPRTGVYRIGTDGTLTAVDSTTVPIEIVDAAFEMAAIIAADPSAFSLTDQSSNIQSLRAGSAGITYFDPTSTRDGTARVLPTVVDRLVGRLVSQNGSINGAGVGGKWTGGDCESNFDDCAQIKRPVPF